VNGAARRRLFELAAMQLTGQTGRRGHDVAYDR